MRTVVTAISVAAMIVGFAVPASAATVLSAGWSEGCGKTNCFDAKGAYTKSWSAADVGGPITIGQLLLDRGVLGDLDSKTFRLSFRLNGEELGTWGNYTMGGIVGDELSFQGANFTWNPEDGELELVLELVPPPIPGITGARFASILPEGDGGPRGPQGQQGEQGGQGGALIPPVQQPGSHVSPAPEPATWALLIGGFGLTGAAVRRRRAVLRMQPCG